MRSLGEIEHDIAGAADSAELLRLAEQVLEHWIAARDETPTKAKREGFRLLALHRQGAKGEPSFNACRETCRELIYHHNLIAATGDPAERARLLGLAGRVAMHLYLFVAGKLEDAGLGEFCCSSRDARRAAWRRENHEEQRGETRRI